MKDNEKKQKIEKREKKLGTMTEEIGVNRS
ncbi:hypothetical protein HNR36_001932 [Ureibacillus thermosphaericus]|jgi:hypothetical protein|uniref:Uncharacterized protein n=1 Tax=Ureibacillus thermosphaericus TaxID=51173 RepID=A0A840PUJ4_URETH|nr:hypothetical protein [Ureibacillus thermosphaericus]